MARSLGQRPLIIFLAGSVIVGWALTFLAAWLSTSSVLLPLIAIPVSYVPAVLAVLVLRVWGTDAERAAFKRRLTTWRVGWRWVVVAVVALPAIHLIGVGLATFAGGSFPVHPALAGLLVLFIVTNFGEEIGWRGYALPKLQERMSPLAAALVLGVVWAMFHWVALLGNADAPWAFVAISTAHLMAISVLLTFVFNGSGQSVPLVALAHAAYDTVSIGVVPLAETGLPLVAFGLTAVVAWVAVIVLVAVKGRALGADDPRNPDAVGPGDARIQRPSPVTPAH